MTRRIGKLDERLGWFAEYGVRECWVLHQIERRLEVISLAGGRVVGRQRFDERGPIQSAVLPEFGRTVASILTWDD